ncbi:hypothetical protein [Mucilaginibacter sp. L3T2-6]|uniref:hypothetical protein n=1 Tax=Mucilaginibacter sp. L3T2-6 TaxID=3062491 RepID=UPI002674FA97|nr:hypothetical protein [Mucilaginibacter sp. L3T2-6]MDO3645235.1 hypothetical protein [Mucilaginibacter sp. L3T2-6]MDV6217687.1 hypothetical protein [Mucilaginibacter sp. L3T2-6]
MKDKLLQYNKIVFAAVLVVFLLICYRLSISRTVEAWQLNKQLTSRSAHISDISVQPSYIVRKGRNIKNILGLYRIDSAELRNNIISKIASMADIENVHLSEAPMQSAPDSTSKAVLQQLNFAGNYGNILKFLNKLQHTRGLGLVRTVIIQRDKKLKEADKKLLACQIYLEMLKEAV